MSAVHLPGDAAPFVHTSHAQRVVFGYGTLARVAAEVDALGARRALVLCTPRRRGDAERLAGLLGERAAGIFDGAAMHVPVESARAGREAALRCRADCTVAFGGGSTVGLAKALALDPGLPILAVPTTYSGSEMTPVHGLTEGGVKRTGRDARVLPRTVIYDPALSLGLPADVSATSGINAIAHAAEGLYAADADPLTSLLAEEGIAALGRALPAIHADPSDRRARADALYGAWLCGSVLAGVGMSLHHKLCHTLGGSFDLPHAATHTVVLPHALAYNAPAAGDAMRRIARALGAADGDAPRAVHALARALGAPTALKDLGLREADLERACQLALTIPYPNPRPVEAHGLRRLLRDAYDGVAPAAAPAAPAAPEGPRHDRITYLLRRHRHRHRPGRPLARRAAGRGRPADGADRARAPRRHLRQRRLHADQDAGGERARRARRAPRRRLRRAHRRRRSAST